MLPRCGFHLPGGGRISSPYFFPIASARDGQIIRTAAKIHGLHFEIVRVNFARRFYNGRIEHDSQDASSSARHGQARNIFQQGLPLAARQAGRPQTAFG